jgi:hypothetical protein
MTSNIRITVIALAAAFAVAVSAAPIVPAAHAEDSIVPLPVNEFCANKWNEFAAWVRAASEADRSGDTGSRDYYLDQARKAKNAAEDVGCDWVRRAAVDPLGGGPVGDGLSIQQPDNSPTTGSVQTETPETTDSVQTETPETVNSGADTSKHKHKHKHKHKRKKRKSRRAHPVV